MALPGTLICAGCGHLNNYHRLGIDPRDGPQDGRCKSPLCECLCFVCPHPPELSWLVRGARTLRGNMVGVTCLCSAGVFKLEDGWAWREVGPHALRTAQGMRVVGGGQRERWTAEAQAWFDRARRDRPKVHCREWRPGDPEDRYHAPRCLEPPAPPKERKAVAPPVEPLPRPAAPLTAEEHAALDERELRAFRDPLLTGELLEFVLMAIRAERCRIAIKGTRDLVALSTLWLGWDNRPIRIGGVVAPWQLMHLVERDAPRYIPDRMAMGAGPCEAPMIRRRGPCGREGSDNLTVAEHSPFDGTVKYHYFCNRHKLASRACAAVVTRQEGTPRPRPNHGGALMRHLPTWNWKSIYRWASPSWSPPRELFVDEEALGKLHDSLFGEGGDLPRE